jgi:hypothetical protein
MTKVKVWSGRRSSTVKLRCIVILKEKKSMKMNKNYKILFKAYLLKNIKKGLAMEIQGMKT